MLVSANIFQPLIDVFQSVISFFHSNMGISWGWSIVLLTVCVRIVLMPLTIKQFQSMRAMQRHAPELKAIQRKYKEDKQRQQQEMMKFYRENNVNPLASCLPMALQLPVMISLFYMLRKNLRNDICQSVQTKFQAKYAHSYALSHHVSAQAAAHAAASQTTACSTYGAVKGSGFLFIHDITNTAHGLTLVVLLVLYVGTQLASTLLMAQPTMDKSQRQMMLIMPVIFVVFIIRFPAGLIVYWITTNGWQVLQSLVIKRSVGPPPAPVTSGDGGSGGALTGSAGSGGSNGGGLFGRLMERMQPPTSDGATRGGGNARSGSAGKSKTPKKLSAGSDGSSAAKAPSGPPPSARRKKKRSGRRR